MYIKDIDGKYEISDFGRVFIILWVELENEGKYICKYLGKNEIVFLNVICKIFVKNKFGLYDFKYFYKNYFGKDWYV